MRTDNQRIVVSLFIKKGASNFIDHIDAVFKKKKRKTASLSIPTQEYSVYDFVQEKQFSLTHKIIQTQVSRSVQGKTRSSHIFQVQNDNLGQNIHKFRLLYQKFIVPPSLHVVQNQQHDNNTYKNIRLNKHRQYLSEIFQDQVIQKQIHQNQLNFTKFYQQRELEIQKMFSLIQLKSISLKNKLQILEQQSYLRKNLCEFANFKVFNELYNISQGEQKIKAIKNFHYQRWIKQLCKVTVLKDICYQRIKIQGQGRWQSNFIKQQQLDILNKKINGKILYSVEQQINQFKKVFQGNHQQRENIIRKKKEGFNYKPCQKPQKILNHQKLPKFSNCQSDICNKNNNLNDSVPTYQKSQYSIIQTNQAPNQNSTQTNSKISKNKCQTSSKNIQKYHLSKIMTASPTNAASRSRTIKNYKYIPEKMNYPEAKNTPFNYSNSSFLPQKLINSMNKIPKKYSKKAQFKFPIKIQSFQVYSSQYSNICYDAQSINLKQLSLRFIQDRLKFKQNKVKIQYSFNHDKALQEIIFKSMHILSCLGAEVYCQMGQGYEFWNQIDDIDILSVSLLTNLPARRLVLLYGQFVCGKNTLR